MKRWRRTVRIGLLTVAGVVLLATAVPQVASGIGLTSLANRLASLTSCSSGSSGSDSSGSSCCSDSSGGSSGSGSAGCPTGPGTVSGTVTVTGVPKGKSPTYLGAGACPYVDASSLTALCPDPLYALAATGDGTYSLSLDPGSWVISGFYEVNPFGGAFIGTPQVVTVPSGGTLALDLSVPYVKPATLHGVVKVTGLPTGVPLQDVQVLLCPAGSPYTGDPAPLTCVSTSSYFGTPGTTSGTVTQAGLPAGSWTAYPGYCTQFGCVTDAGAGRKVTFVAGRPTRVRLTVGYQVPAQGLVNATVTVTGAPAGFNAAVGVTACKIVSLLTTCQGYGGEPDGTAVSLQLDNGLWELTGMYYAPVFGNAITGPTELVDVQGGQVQNLTVTVPYQVLGTAAGSIKVAGLPSGTRVTSYTVTACPESFGGTFGFLSCVTEYSGPGSIYYGPADTRRLGRTASRVAVPRTAGARLNAYSLPTLVPGVWDLSVQYSTAFGTFGGTTQTRVTVAAGQTTTTKLTVPYQPPTMGDVTGKVSVVGAPQFGFQAGARACSSAPVAGACTNEVDAFLGTGSTYQLNLTPGTWWVQGIAYNYMTPFTTTVTTAPRQVTVSVGSKVKENFTVAFG